MRSDGREPGLAYQQRPVTMGRFVAAGPLRYPLPWADRVYRFAKPVDTLAPTPAARRRPRATTGVMLPFENEIGEPVLEWTTVGPTVLLGNALAKGIGWIGSLLSAVRADYRRGAIGQHDVHDSAERGIQA